MKDLSKKSDAAPHDCTECGSPAYIPFNGPARCTGVSVASQRLFEACSRFDQQIYDEHVESCPDESVSVDLDVDMFVKQYREVQHVLNTPPLRAVDGGWWYQANHDMASGVYPGDRMTDNDGRKYRVDGVDRVKDQIHIIPDHS